MTDDGPGIPAGLQPDLFDRFVRGNGRGPATSGGTGLGLAIVDAVVAAHQGTVTLTSHPAGPGSSSPCPTCPTRQSDPGFAGGSGSSRG